MPHVRATSYVSSACVLEELLHGAPNVLTIITLGKRSGAAQEF